MFTAKVDVVRLIKLYALKHTGVRGKERQSILKKAFAKQFVPQDLNDEPASVLLERIKKQRLLNKNKTAPEDNRNENRKRK